MGNYPIVGHVKCCRPSPVSSKKATGGISSHQSAITQSDTSDIQSDMSDIWAEIIKIKKALGIK